jgi:hypothetical protein
MHRYGFLILVLLLASPSAFAMRCGNRIVDVGAQDFQVRERCGEPFWTDHYSSIEILGAYGPLEQQQSVQFDVWYYNFGPSQLMRRIVFRNGIALRESTLGYGVSEIGANCDPKNATYAGLSVGELVARCGEPTSRRDRSGTIASRPAPGFEQWRDQRREEWVYDTGDSGFVNVVRIVDGRVTGVDRVSR